MNPPKSINVVGKTYSITLMEKVDDKDSMGEHELSKQTLKLKKDQHADSMRETLLHEVIHAVEEQFDLGMRERQVHNLSNGLFQVLRENADFVKFITEKAHRGK